MKPLPLLLIAIVMTVGVFACVAQAARSPAPVPTTWFDRALTQRGMLDRNGNDLGKPWMVDCAGLGNDHAADNATLFFHFRCLISLGKVRYLQDYRTWQAGTDKVTWTPEGKLWRLVPSHATAP